MRLTAPTEVYAPYQGSEWGRSFSLLTDYFLTAHCSPLQRGNYKGLTLVILVGYTGWLHRLVTLVTLVALAGYTVHLSNKNQKDT